MEKVVLTTQDYHYTCGDGCCDNYGQRLFINGEEINAELEPNPHYAIELILRKLGYEVEWEELEYDRFDARM